jgi:diacylglycerol kinase family enzyme
VPDAVFVANPTAQSGKAAAWIDLARTLLDAAGIPHEFQPTEPDGGTVEVVRRAVDEGGARLIIAMGGDGTFAEAAKGILDSEHAAEVRLGMLPTGTANDQGKSFGLSAGPDALPANIHVIASGATIALDVGRVEVLDHHDRVLRRDRFFDSMSVGFMASALATRNRDRELVGKIPLLGMFYRDHAVYAGALARRLLETYVADTTFDLEVDVDGHRYSFENLFDCILKNTHVFGGEWVLDPDASPSDGRFELVPIRGRIDFGTKLVANLRHLPLDEVLGMLGVEHSEAIPGSQFKMTIVSAGADRFPSAQIDGEELGAGERYRIDVLPRCLRLIVPSRRAAS